MNSFKDAFSVIMGKDLEETSSRKKSSKKVSPSTEKKGKPEIEKKPEKAPEKQPYRKPVSSQEAMLQAYDYISDKEKLSADMKAALMTGSLSEELSRLLQVVFDKKAVRDLVSAQGDVRPPAPKAEDIRLDYSFIDPDGKDCSEQAELLLGAGTSVEDLAKFNIKLKVVKKLKSDGSVIGDASEAEYKQIVQQIKDKKSDK